jgi:hypothetical protein
MGDVVPYHLEMRVGKVLENVVLAAGEEVVGAHDFVAALE